MDISPYYSPHDYQSNHEFWTFSKHSATYDRLRYPSFHPVERLSPKHRFRHHTLLERILIHHHKLCCILQRIQDRKFLYRRLHYPSHLRNQEEKGGLD
jgi:hypothetical protein